MYSFVMVASDEVGKLAVEPVYAVARGLVEAATLHVHVVHQVVDI